MAARRPQTRTPATRVPVVMPEEAESRQWLRGMRLSGFTVVMLGIIVLAVIVLAPGLRTLVEQQQQIAALRESVRLEQQAVNDLEANLDRWKDPAYVEAEARNRLLYVFPGDITYLVIDDGATGDAIEQPISDEIQTTQTDWTRSLLSSVISAGTTQQTAQELTK
jgi:cell division protein FtsB